jgi:exonuclease III
VRLLTWNLAGRVALLPAQVAALAVEEADVVALQEVRHRMLGTWIAALAELGFAHVVASREPGEVVPRDGRVLDVLIAARWPLAPLAAVQEPMPWPERVAGALLAAPTGPVEVHCVHAPISSRANAVKVRTLEALARGLATPRSRPRVLAGDLNTPRSEGPGSELSTFARTRGGALIPDRGERHEAAERGILRLPGFVDAFRAVHGPDVQEVSWSPRGHSDRGGHRLDHVLATPELRPVAAAYRHAWRRDGLSDHSGLVVDLAP